MKINYTLCFCMPAMGGLIQLAKVVEKTTEL